MQQAWANDISKLNKMEHVKLEKDGLDILTEIELLAKAGFAAIRQEDLDLLKWAGVYVQKPKTEGYFMLRVKLPSGLLSASQSAVLADIAADYGREQIQFTTRQAAQFHWIRIENLPDIFARLKRADLSSVEACGDCPRTVIGSPLAGIDPEELFDTRPIVSQVTHFFQGNREFSNLPRKFKISISASPSLGYAEINDLAFVPAIREVAGTLVPGFHVLVGGGLSAKPHLAQKLDMFVRPEEVLSVASAVATIFRDCGYREQRFHCRLKFLVADWGAEKFRDELLKLTGPLLSAGKDVTKDWNKEFYYGVNRQKQQGLCYVGLNLPGGQVTALQLKGLGKLSCLYGDGSLRTTNSQNIIIANIPENKVNLLLQESLLQKLSPQPKPFSGHAVACTGSAYCNLALVETKERLKAITAYLDEQIHLDPPLRIHVAGCPNACGQHHIADIGLQGTIIKKADAMIEGFEIFVGGVLGPEGTFATKLKGRIPADEVAQVIKKLAKIYKANKHTDETMRAFIDRAGLEVFQEIVDVSSL